MVVLTPAQSSAAAVPAIAIESANPNTNCFIASPQQDHPDVNDAAV